MKVSDKMTRSPRVASPDDAIRDAAGAMAQADTGVLPVGENDGFVSARAKADATSSEASSAHAATRIASAAVARRR